MRIFRLFRDLDPASYCIVTTQDIEPDDPERGRQRLPGDYHRLPSEWRRLNGPSKGVRKGVYDWLNVWLKAVQRARNLARVLRTEKCKALVVFTGDLEDMPAAWWAARWARCSLIPVFDDDYIHQWIDPVKRLCARFVERRLVRASAGIFTISEFSQAEYRKRYGVDSVVLHSPTPAPVGAPPTQVPIRSAPEALKILFAGSVYHANYDAITTLLQGLQLLEGIDARLHIYTPQPVEVIRKEVGEGPFVVHASVGSNKIGGVQSDADILFLPLGLKTLFPEVMRTSCPTKLADYLVSGRPILVYAPKESFLSSYVRENGCGLVVDHEDPHAIRDAITRLAQDEGLRLSVVSQAFACAARTFDCRKNQQLFLDHIREWTQAQSARP